MVEAVIPDAVFVDSDEEDEEAERLANLLRSGGLAHKICSCL